MDLIEIVEPSLSAALLVVPIGEMRSHMRIMSTSRDAELQSAVHDACMLLHGKNGLLNRALLPSDFRLYLSEWPGDRIELPLPPMISLASVQYRDPDDVLRTLPADQYTVATNGLHAVVHLTADGWPEAVAHPRAITISYRAGYESVPQPLRRAVKLLAGHYIENSEATINEMKQTAVNRKLEFGLDHLISSYRILNDYS
jgi:uncharacterized phiE125 gp8 family phage protein